MLNKLKKESVLSAAAWMTILGALFFWLPVFGSFIAGFIGGRMVGEPGKAILAAIIPAVAVGIVILILSSIIAIPGAAGLAGTTLGLWIVGDSLPLCIGALIGGWY